MKALCWIGRAASHTLAQVLVLIIFALDRLARIFTVGLAIVSHIVAEHGGQIRVEDNKPGEEELS